MSNLSYLEELLGGIEVEWKALGKVAEYSTIPVDADEETIAKIITGQKIE